MNQSLSYEFANVMPQVLESGIFNVTASFFDRVGGANPVADSMGQVNQTQVPVAGLQNITAMFSVARLSNLMLPDEGMRASNSYEQNPTFHLLLQGYFPAILPRFTVQVSGDPSVYEITPGTVQSDSQQRMTRCKLRRFNF